MTNKVELNELTQVVHKEQAFLVALNDNFTRIQQAINDTLSRSGVVPNQMEEILDMNGKRIANTGAPEEDGDVVTKAYIQGLVDSVESAIARADALVEEAQHAIEIYASEYIYPTVQAAVDAAIDAKDAAKDFADDAKGYYDDTKDLYDQLSGLASSLSELLTVYSHLSDITTIVNNLSDITTVSGISSDVTAVSGISSDVTAVADNATNITAVNANKTNIDKVANIANDVSTVATIPGSIYTVATNISKVSAVADNETNVNTVAADIAKVADVSDNMISVVNVSNNMSDISAVEDDLSNIDTVVDNLTAINAAPTYAENARKWAVGTIVEQPAGSAKYWAERAHTITEEVVRYDRISNLLLELPRDIKLELSEGTLTLKAGSVVTFPDGSQYELTADLTCTSSLDRTWMLFYDGAGHLQVREPDHCFAGDTAPTAYPYMVWFDTTNKIVKYTGDSGSTWSGSWTLPLAVFTVSDGAISSIDQIFNGIGYMDLAVFSLPGIRGLIPDGINTDGTLKSTNIVTTSVHISQYAAGTYTRNLLMSVVGGLGSVFDFLPGTGYYDHDKNLIIRGGGSALSGQCHIGVIEITSGVITKLEIFPVFSLVDYKYFQDELAKKQNTLTFDNTPTADSTNPVTSGGVYSSFESVNTALASKAGLADNNNFTGTNTFVTQPASDNSTKAATTAMVHSYMSALRSNCIAEMPQDIIMTLSEGTLTLKSGSVVTYPDGTQVQMTADVSTTLALNRTWMVFYDGLGHLQVREPSNCHSGSEAPTGAPHMVWYDTTNNVIKTTADGGSTWSGSWSFPVAIMTVSGGAISSIDQIFNGVGYIGSALFALPGVSCLIPNGRNEDGTLKNTVSVDTVVHVTELTGTGTRYLLMNHLGGIGFNYDLYPGSGGYDHVTNYVLRGSGAISSDQCIIGIVEFSSSRIDKLVLKTVFRGVDYDDFYFGNVDLGDFTTAKTQDVSDSSTKLATTGFVGNKFQLVNALPATPVNGVFYFISEP